MNFTNITTSLHLQTGIVWKYVIMYIAIITTPYIWMILTSSFPHCGATFLCKKPILQKASSRIFAESYIRERN